MGKSLVLLKTQFQKKFQKLWSADGRGIHPTKPDTDPLDIDFGPKICFDTKEFLPTILLELSRKHYFTL